TNLTLHLWDGDARSFYGYRVETSADPVHNGWSLLWDSTQNGCAGGGLATRVGPTMPGSAGGVCTSANVDYQGRQVLSFSPQDVRYVRVFLTGSTASSAGLLTEVLAGASASASLLVNQDQFIWIRGYDLFSVVFLINNVASQVYNQQVNGASTSTTRTPRSSSRPRPSRRSLIPPTPGSASRSWASTRASTTPTRTSRPRRP